MWALKTHRIVVPFCRGPAGINNFFKRSKMVFEEDCERAYEKGYIQGANAAYGKGSRDGYKDGYVKGWREGYKKGWCAGYKKGYIAVREKVLAGPQNLSG
jgi:flagellar biosynthesis/type III secretory pathway protein FliH